MALIKTLASQFAKIKVLGIGGGGNNAINSMISDEGITGVDFVAINTDSQVLLNSLADVKIQIGQKLTKGLGSGGNPEIGQKAAEESREKLKEILQDTDMIFITGGMGGGTCTGAAPIIADIAKNELSILTIAIVTKPFLFEGTRRMTNAQQGISLLKKNVDTLIVIPNQKVLEIVKNKTTFQQALKMADSVLSKGTKAISELITTPGLINLDFADVKSIMAEAGTALMGVGEAQGEDRAQKAIQAAIASPLIEVDIDGARGVLINISGGPDLTIAEIEESAQKITKLAAPDANIIFGATIDETQTGKIKITVIATGFDDNPKIVQHQIQQNQQSYKQEPVAKPKTDQKTDNKLPKNLDDALKDQFIPEGVDIVDEYDIPSFLRK